MSDAKRIKTNCQWSKMVKEFHVKHRHPVGTKLGKYKGLRSLADKNLYWLATELWVLAKDIEHAAIIDSISKDHRRYRAHLMIEELSEAVLALAYKNKHDLFDGLLDLAYTCIGTGVTYGLPMEEGFAEVHRSNMTKPKRTKADLRQRRKPKTYSPPDLRRILNGIEGGSDPVRGKDVRSRRTAVATRAAAGRKGTVIRSSIR